mmetsp:Transcript_13185/g.19753  ORF Transcript_13185/g.19753 Transcript_13185/m.19753 type:complete len:233 (+) Transcript_13185:158-856(+)
MSCLCIGGVCIPYAGLIPLLLFALKWVAAQLWAKVGLLPDFVATRLGLQQQQQSEKETSSCAEGGGSCCTSETKKPRRRTARESSTASTASTTTTDVDDNNEDEKKEDNNDGISGGGGGEVEHIDALTRWTEVFTQSRQSSSSSLLFVKFTAEWCKPCRVIQPAYTSLAAQYPKYKFVTVDVDGDDCDALSSKLRVAMMPTFICFRSGGEVGRMSGGNNPEGLKSWVEKMSL